MASVIYTEKNVLLKTETQLLCKVLEMILTKASMESFGCPPSELKDPLDMDQYPGRDGMEITSEGRQTAPVG